jgi:PAS domain S-box-containing protein
VTAGSGSIELAGRLDAVVFEARPSPLRLLSAHGSALARFGVAAPSGPGDGVDPELLTRALHPDDRDEVLAGFARVAADGQSRTLEHRLVSADGHPRWFRTEVHAVDFDGERRLRGVLIDVTELQRTLERLRATEARLSQVVSNAPLSLFAIDEKGTFTLAEGSGLRAIGLQPGQAVGVNIFDVWPEEGEVLDHVRRALNGEAYTAIDEVKQFGSSWETRWAPIVDAEGRRRGATAVALNITERRRAEEERNATVSLLRATLEAVTDGVLVVDTAGRMVDFNRRFLDMWHMPEEIAQSGDEQRALAHAVSQLRDPDAFLGKVRALYAEPHAASHDVVEFRDGRIFERDSRPQRVDGKPVGRVWSFRDVTAEHRASRRASFLAAASKLLASSLDEDTPLDMLARLSLPFLGDWCILYLVGADGSIEPAAAHHVDPALLPLLKQLRIDPRNTDRGVMRALAEGTPVVYNDVTVPELRGEDNSRVVVALTAESQRILAMRLGLRGYMAVPLRVRGQTIGAMSFATSDPRRRYDDSDVAVASDLAQRAALTIDNRRLYRRSVDAVATRDEFLSVASHELRTPVTSLQLAVQSLLAVGLDAPPGFLQKSLESVERQMRRLARLVDALFDVSRVQAGRLELQRESVDLGALARDVVRGLGADAARAGCSVAVETEAQPLMGTWDRARLEQVVTNLLANALKYGAGRPVTVAVQRHGEEARLSVSDHGIGVPPSERQRIFERFGRAVSARHYGGLGLGLYIVRRIVEAHGGTVGVEDGADGNGARFTVRLPL